MILAPVRSSLRCVARPVWSEVSIDTPTPHVPLAALVKASMAKSQPPLCTGCGDNTDFLLYCECGSLCPPCWAEHRSPSACPASVARSVDY